MAISEPRLPSVLPIANTLLRSGLFHVPVVRGVMDALYDTYKRKESLPLFPTDTQLNTYDVVIDVGAGLGFFTRWIHDHTPPTTKILSFEPDALNFQILRRRISTRNHLSRIAIYEKALSDKSGSVSFSRNLSHFGDHTVDRSGAVASRVGREAVMVQAVTLSEIVQALPAETKSILIKLDVQGHEPFVLQGLTSHALGDRRCDVLTEFSPYHLHAQGIDPQEFVTLLAQKSDHCRFRDSLKNFVNLNDLAVDAVTYTDIWCENFKAS